MDGDEGMVPVSEIRRVMRELTDRANGRNRQAREREDRGGFTDLMAAGEAFGLGWAHGALETLVKRAARDSDGS